MQTNDEGRTSLYIAAGYGYTEVVKELLESKHCTPEFLMCATKSGDTALISAMFDGRANVIDMLLNSKHCTLEFLMHANHAGETALSIAKQKGLAEIVQKITEKIDSLRSKNKIGFFEKQQATDEFKRVEGQSTLKHT